jgi:hypothetical protein
VAVSSESGKTLKTIGPEDARRLGDVFLLISKIVLLLVPYFFKWSTDALNGKMDLRRHLPTFMLGALMLVVAYNARPPACRWRSTSCATRCLPASASMPCASSPTRPSSICTSCRCASIWSAHRRPVARHRARHQGHRDDRSLHHPQHRSDADRIRADGAIFWWGYGFLYLFVTA